MEDVREYFKFYIGQECSYPDTDGKIVKAILTGVTTDQLETTYKRKRNGCYGDYLSFKSNGYHNSDALHLKLHLRRLDSMTEEDIDLGDFIPDFNVLIQRFTGGYCIEIDSVHNDGYCLTIYPDGSMYCICKDTMDNYPYKGGDLMRQLLKKGFWLFGDEAFDKGLIIDSKTLNKEV